MAKKLTVLQKAQRIRELNVSLENISTDDKRELSSYTDREIADEAEYVLSLYSEGGTLCSQELAGEFGREEQRIARKSVKQLKALIAEVTFG